MKASELVKDFSVEDSYKELRWTGTFDEYLDIVQENPRVLRNAYQRLYDMIQEAGQEDFQLGRKTIQRHRFFSDISGSGKEAIFGIEGQLDKFVSLLRGGALSYGPEKRIILLHGPVGSAKSTIARLLKKGLENYSCTPEGVMYTYQWRDEKTKSWVDAPMHEEPLKLLPAAFKDDFVKKLFTDKELVYPITTHLSDLNPSCRKNYSLAMEKHKGDWHAMVKNCIRVKRLILSEKDRIGIGTYQPKDEKSQDATELTGDINYRKIAEYGSDSDPRAFNFDGEFNVANRGIIEFIELLKLDVAFLYDLLGATQERKVKPRKFALTDIDEVIIGHTNNPEYKRLQSNELMEAFKDRTTKVDVPYNLVLSDEIRIYERDFSDTGKHIAPHTLTVASMCLTDPDNGKITLMQKLKLYDGKSLPGSTVDSIEELREEGGEKGEGMQGISPRFIQSKISNALSSNRYNHVNPFVVMNEISEGLKHHTLITSKEMRHRYLALLEIVKAEYEDIVKNEVQKAICADEDAIGRMCANYIDNVKAYTQREKIRNKYTGKEEEADEKLMRSIEEKIDIPESRKKDFRKELMNHIGALAIEKKPFEYWTNERLNKALELKLFEDSRHTIKLNTLLTNVIDAETQQKTEVVKARLITTYGYNEESARDVLQYVASIFARGDTKDN
jgi:serine protein kinase